MARFLLAAALMGPAAAWWDNGHMLTAEVARQLIGEANASRLDALLAAWEHDFPGTSDMVSAAVWPDLVKCKTVSDICKKELPDALGEFSDWHFSDLPYNPDGLKLPKLDAGRNPSAIWALTEAMATFKDAKTVFAFNFMLRMALHITGDLHQPLHACAGYFNNSRLGQHPTGDMGGNLITIRPPPGVDVSNLHMLWDAAGGLYMHNWPLDEVDKEALRANASELLKAFPAKSLMPQYRPGEACRSYKSCNKIFRRWANESHTAAVEDAYGHGLTQNAVPSPEYLENAQQVARRQIVLGGYRLADLLRVIIPLLPREAPATAALPPAVVAVSFWLAPVGALLSALLAVGLALLGLKVKKLHADCGQLQLQLLECGTLGDRGA